MAAVKLTCDSPDSIELVFPLSKSFRPARLPPWYYRSKVISNRIRSTHVSYQPRITSRVVMTLVQPMVDSSLFFRSLFSRFVRPNFKSHHHSEEGRGSLVQIIWVWGPSKNKTKSDI